jgi:hypothetical protein
MTGLGFVSFPLKSLRVFNWVGIVRYTAKREIGVLAKMVDFGCSRHCHNVFDFVNVV